MRVCSLRAWHQALFAGWLALAGSVFPLPVLAQEVIEVPPIAVEDDTATAETPDDPDSLETEPAALDAPTGPVRDASLAPSVQVRESGGPGQPVTLQVRGSDPASTLAALEGVPLNSPFLGGADLSGLALLPLASVGITRGGQSATWGSGAVGGVLQAALPSPLDDPQTSLSLTAGSFGTTRMKVALAHREGPVAGMAALGLFESAGDFPFTDTNGHRRTRTHNAASALDGLGKLEAGWAGGRHRAALLIEGFRDDREVPGLEQFPSETARQQDTRVIVSGRWEGPPLFAREGRADARLYVRRLAFTYDDPSPAMGPAVFARLVAWEVSGEASGEEAVSRWWRIPWSVGATHTRGAVTRPDQPVRSPVRSSVAGRAGVAAGSREAPFRAEAAMRVEWDEGFGVTVLPHVEARVSPWPALALFASAGRSFRLPTFEELYFNAGFVQGNPDLRPEDAWTWDAGVSLSSPGEVARLRAAFFENRVSNLILFLPRSAFLIRAENSGSALLRGMEVEGTVRLGPVGVRATYTFLDARFRGGRAMPHRPRHTVAGEIAFESGEVRVEVRGRGQTAFYLDRYESLTEEGRLVVDARVEWTPVPEASVALDVHNVLDRRGAVDSLQSPLPGRAFYGSLRVFL